MQVPEYSLGDLRLLVRRGPTEMVETDVEPSVDLGVQRIVLIANLPGCQAFLESQMEPVE